MIRHAQKCDKLLRLLKEHVEFLESTTTFFERFEDALSPIPDGSANLDIEAFLDEVSAFIKAYEKLRTDVLEHKQQLDTPFTAEVPVTPVVYSSKATPTPPQIATTYSSRNGTDQRPEWVKMFRDVGEVIIHVCVAVMVFFFVVVGSLCGLIIVANKIWPEQLERLFPAEDEKSS